jgi:hypothetical protein
MCLKLTSLSLFADAMIVVVLLVGWMVQSVFR